MDLTHTQAKCSQGTWKFLEGKTEIYAKNDYSPEGSTYFLEGTPVFLKENWTEANKFIFPEAKTNQHALSRLAPKISKEAHHGERRRQDEASPEGEAVLQGRARVVFREGEAQRHACLSNAH